MSACCTSTCYEDLKEFIGQTNYDFLLDKGFVDEDTVNGTSFVCRLVPFFINNNISTTEATSIMSSLVDKGLVYDCVPNSIIASVETYLKYAEAVGLTQSTTP